jgi:hypothetical protein
VGQSVEKHRNNNRRFFVPLPAKWLRSLDLRSPPGTAIENKHLAERERPQGRPRLQRGYRSNCSPDPLTTNLRVRGRTKNTSALVVARRRRLVENA